MVDILHRVGVKAPLNEVYRALATREGVAAWWTTDTQGESKVGGVIKFRFGELGGFDMKVLALEPGKRVLWEVVDGPEEWIGTKVDFDLKQDGDYTIILFNHQGWKEPGQRPEFEEITVVLKGMLRVEHEAGKFDVREGQAVITSRGEWVRYSTPEPGGAEYVAVCVPAFTLDSAHRDG